MNRGNLVKSRLTFHKFRSRMPARQSSYLLHCICRLMADFVAEVCCKLFWSVIPSL